MSRTLTATLWGLIAMVTAILSLTLGLGAMGGAHHVAYAMHAPAATTWCTPGTPCRPTPIPAANHVGIMSAAVYVTLAAGFMIMATAMAWVTPRRRRRSA